MSESSNEFELALAHLVQGNELIESAYKMALDEMRLLCLALSHIKAKQPKPEETYRIPVQGFIGTFNIDPRNAYSAMRDAAIGLSEKSVLFQRLDSRGRLKWIRCPWFSKVEYFAGEGSYVEVEFSKYVEPYIYNISSNFTEIELQNLTRLESAFAVRLYSWLVRYRYYNKTKKNGGNEVSLHVDWMKERTLLQDKHDDIRYFKRWVIEPAIKQINAHTDIYVTYKPVKDGRRIKALSFFYIEQNSKLNKEPLRPRLPRRPHVTKGTHEEGLWARRCIELLLSYREQLKPFDKHISLADLRKLVSYYQLIGDTLSADRIQASIDKRQTKKVA